MSRHLHIKGVLIQHVCLDTSLPLAHVLEFTVEQLALYLGIPIGYGVQNRSKGNATSVGMCWNCSISCGGISVLMIQFFNDFVQTV